MVLSRAFLRVKASGPSAIDRAGKHVLKIVTYNVLASKYAVSGYHNYCDPRFLKWEYRRPRLFEELKSYDSDILCLQEVEQKVFHDELVPWLADQGFKGWYMARQSGEVAGEPEGVALFYRDSMFRPISHRTVCFAQCPTPLDPTKSGNTSADPKGFWDIFKRREEGAIMALLEHTPSGRQLIAACTHLFWNPMYPDVKVLQATTLCQEIRRFMSEFCTSGASTPLVSGHSGSNSRAENRHMIDVPILIGGDFNSLWRKYKSDAFDKIPYGQSLQSGVYTLLSEGVLRPDHPDHPYTRRGGQGASTSTSFEVSSLSSFDDAEVPAVPRVHATKRQLTTADAFQDVDITDAGLKLQSMHMLAHGWEPPLTTKTANFAGCLDYIWMNGHGEMNVLETLSLPYETSEAKSSERRRSRGGNTKSCVEVEDPLTQVNFPAIPDEDFPSDHLAMGCAIEW